MDVKNVHASSFQKGQIPGFPVDNGVKKSHLIQTSSDAIEDVAKMNIDKLNFTGNITSLVVSHVKLLRFKGV